jgi:Zn-dependent peptidase ImmA (M78 family)/DNA-binding XRE family transcriptional regulator
MLAERLKRARAASGLSLRGLADQVGISHNAVKKYEDGINTPSSDQLLKIARVLGVRTEYFFRQTKVLLDGVEYRKRASTPQTLLRRIEADVLEQAERWQELANLYPAFPIKAFTLPDSLPSQVTSLDAVEMVADALREQWALGQNPIPDLVDMLETQGILVIFSRVEGQLKFDGLAATVGKQPVIVVSQTWAGDRQRFTLAHELGHLLLHGRLAPDLSEEQACNRFAGAFLLPRTAIYQHLGQRRHSIEPRELYMLKHEFGLSMQACLCRAADSGLIDDATRKKLWMRFAKQGWRAQEPGTPYPQEQTFLFNQLVYRALAEDLIGESKAAELLGMPLAKFHRERALEGMDAVAYQ